MGVSRSAVFNLVWWVKGKWCERVPFVNEMVRFPGEVVVHIKWKLIWARVMWSTSTSGVIKMNIDGSFLSSMRHGGIWCIFCGLEGTIVL